jgi:hypothetical protein
MSDISVFKKLLEPEPPRFIPLPQLPKIWLCAYKSKKWPASYYYCLWIGGKTPLSSLFTFNLEHARAAAAQLGETIIEHGPPKAFGRSA